MNKSISQLANELEIEVTKLVTFQRELDFFFKTQVLEQKITSNDINLGLNGYEEYFAIKSITESNKNEVTDLPF